MYTNINHALDDLQKRRNMVFGIDHFKSLLDEMGNPQYNLKCIHIGGTNGKGSTTDFTRAILQKAGYKVGSFTSPHLVKHNDRIRINNEAISDALLLEYINKTEPLWEKYQLSMFEIDMLISIQYFLDEGVDWVIYEVGLGGRLDATNVILPEICAITNVDFDHMDILGETLEAIAKEKAGIIKPNIPLITTERKRETLAVFEKIAIKNNAILKMIEIPSYTNHYEFEIVGIKIHLRNQAVYQIENASLAISIIKALELKIDDEIIKEAVESTHWQGRFEAVDENVYVDGAHNKIGVEKLMKTLESLPRPWIVVFSALKDKDHHDMVEMIVDKVDHLIITEFEFYRAGKAEELAFGFNVEIIKDYQKAILKGKEIKKDGTLIVTGSLYFISEARSFILESK